jgi:hypothetical protein
MTDGYLEKEEGQDVRKSEGLMGDQIERSRPVTFIGPTLTQILTFYLLLVSAVSFPLGSNFPHLVKGSNKNYWRNI